MVHRWFRSYLSGREFFVSMDNHSSEKIDAMCDFPQASISGPIIFSLCMLPLGRVIREHNIHFHSYADDTQLYIYVSPDYFRPVKTLLNCIHDISLWMSQNLLNQDKTR